MVVLEEGAFAVDDPLLTLNDASFGNLWLSTSSVLPGYLPTKHQAEQSTIGLMNFLDSSGG